MSEPIRLSPRKHARNSANTRALLLAAAKRRFAKYRYGEVGLREICADAGVDPALVNRYFGTKRELFAAALASIGEAPLPLGCAADDFGRKLAREIILPSCTEHDERLAALRIALRSASSPEVQAIAQRDIFERYIAPIAARFREGSDAAARAHLCVALIMGLSVHQEFGPFGGQGDRLREELIKMVAPILNALAAPESEPGMCAARAAS